MKTYHLGDAPLKLFGVPLYDREGVWARLPQSVLEAEERLKGLAARCPGARLCFRTDAEEIIVKYTLKTFRVDIGMSIYACQSAHVLAGDRKNPYFAGLINPQNYDDRHVVGTAKKKPVMEDVTIFLPRNEGIENLRIEIPDEAHIEAPTPYDGKPMVFYGSSITEGGCCCNPFNVYSAVISNHLNYDYVNIGLSASAHGEPTIADYINTLDMSVFVYDYDNNSPSPETLKETHEPFFKQIRAQHPTLPIIMMSMPKEIYTERHKARRDVIRQTYENALAAGDKNVYYIDGETFCGTEDRYRCFIDGTHPNDLGFARMAEIIEPVVRKALGL